MKDSDFEAAIENIEYSLKEKKRIKAAILGEIYKAFERLEASPELLSIVGSYGDTLSDEEVLRLLKDWNAGGRILNERQ